MNTQRFKHKLGGTLAFALLVTLSTQAQELRQLSVSKPQAIADLRTTYGAALLKAKWYVQNTNGRNRILTGVEGFVPIREFGARKLNSIIMVSSAVPTRTDGYIARNGSEHICIE